MTTEQQKAFEAWFAEADEIYDYDYPEKIAMQTAWQAAIAWHKKRMQSPEMVGRVKIAIENADDKHIKPVDNVYMLCAKAAIAALTETPQPQVGLITAAAKAGDISG